MPSPDGARWSGDGVCGSLALPYGAGRALIWLNRPVRAAARDVMAYGLDRLPAVPNWPLGLSCGLGGLLGSLAAAAGALYAAQSLR
ncbi:hypothetical protein ACRJ4B_00455 [Streptomyces sp. GTA36]